MDEKKSRCTLSIITTTLNSEPYIERFCNAHQWIDEIIITDAGSTDKTKEIANKYKNVRWFELPGCTYSEGFVNSCRQSSTDWVIMLGSDEVLGFDVEEELKRVLPTTKYDGFFLPFYIRVFGEWIIDMPSKSRIIRVSRREKALFEDKRIHERMLVNGPIGNLTNYAFHYQDNSVSERLRKMDKYTTLGVMERRESGDHFSFLRMFTSPLKYFFWHFILLRKAGQGIRGFYLSVWKAYYQFTEEIKLFESEQMGDDIK